MNYTRWKDLKDIGLVTIQQLANTIDESGRHQDWIEDFKLKYGIG